MIRIKKQAGATLMEVLITMVIMLVGLVGLTQLFSKAKRTTAEAYDRHRAVAMADQMAEMMRSMVRSKPSSTPSAAHVCPAISETLNLASEQAMACFVQETQGATGYVGRFSNEPAANIQWPTNAVPAGNCTTTRCSNRMMVSYLANEWASALSNENRASALTAGVVTSNRNFTARGCVRRICDTEGNIWAGATPSMAGSACPNPIDGIYRVTVFWITEEGVAPDAAINYCGLTPTNYWRYTYLDVALPSPFETKK